MGDGARKANSACPACLTPNIMLDMYHIAIQYYLREQYHAISDVDPHPEKSLNHWLQSIFANPAYPCILVQCPRTTPTTVVASSTKSTHRRQGKKTTMANSHFTDESNAVTNDCPICNSGVVEKESSQSSSQKKPMQTHGEQRRPPTRTYHLVDVDLVCWQRIDTLSLSPGVLNANEEEKGGEEEQGDSDEDEEFNHQHCLLSRSTPHTAQSRVNVKTVKRPRIFSLSQYYDETSRHIFIDKLGVS
ncbi:unnamed protein product [Trichobilharzia regenti]|nr:unnamed protein product [Trichobilharzia regenti]